jgi:crossover junction endodeoxyribonuclease RuvC
VNALALDVSLTATGYAVSCAGGIADCGVLEPGKLRGVERLAWLGDRLAGLVSEHEPTICVLEGYAFGRPNQAHQLGEAGGTVRLTLHRAAVPVVEIAPALVKLYATGKGNASKEAVLAEAVRRLRYPGSSTDEADALWLLAMTLDHYGMPPAAMPQSNRTALGRVNWPQLSEVAS